MKSIKFALVSPYNKTNLLQFLKKLTEITDLELIATSGSYEFLKNQIPNISPIEIYTGFSESPEGLVKTLHPKIFFGFLGNPAKETHIEVFNRLECKPIDLLISNLYPFWEIKEKKLSIQDMTYYWDIGGPSMIMAAIKGNHTIVLTDPNDYEPFLSAIYEESEKNERFLKELNLKALKYVVNYHTMIGDYFEKNNDSY